MAKNKKNQGKKPLPSHLKRVQRTITISAKAEAIVLANTSLPGGPHENNASTFIDACILSENKNT